jgi:D-threonate/D-erythronate kinase
MIGVIADDLTGAAELAGIGLRYGLVSEVVVGGEFKSDADLICVDTDSRSRKGNEAARRAANAARQLRKAGARWIYKKVDSVLRGNVLAEIGASQKALKLRATLLVPANPCFGRVIRGGRYFVNGKPIDKTDFARDPEHPRTSSKVLEMLGGGKSSAVRICKLHELIPEAGIILGEVSSSADVQKWARGCGAEMLPAGGAEFFGALLKPTISEHVRSAVHEARVAKVDAKNPREFFICGSTSDYTEQFVRESRKDGTPVFSVIEAGAKEFSCSAKKAEAIAKEAIAAFETNARVVLAIGRPLFKKRTIARQLTKWLVDIAGRVIAGSNPGHVYAEGGATAAELVRYLGWNRMEVVEELAPGVTSLRWRDRKSAILTIKPGSYPGWPKSQET